MGEGSSMIGIDKLVELFSFIKGEPTVLEMIEHNEKIIARGTWLKADSTKDLYDHPTIKCHSSKTTEQLASGDYGASYYYHGVQPAVWRRDMKYPICKHCLVEDPYE